MTANPVLMPKLGLTMTEGVLAEWRVGPGDAVKPGDVIFVVETEKIATDVEARAAGTISELLVSPGDTVAVGGVVALWSGPAQGAGDVEPANDEPIAAPEVDSSLPAAGEVAGEAPQPVDASSKRIVVTPLARRMAEQADLSLEGIKGTGPRGRIKSEDVRAAIAKRAEAPLAPPSRALETPSSKQVSTPPAGTRRDPTSVERTIARRLTESKQHIPHFYVMADADVTDLLLLRAQLKKQLPTTRISVNHLIVLAVGRALAANPHIDAVWDDNAIVSLGRSDVGIAVDTPNGLFAPIIAGAGNLRLASLAEAADDLAARAKSGSLTSTDLRGGAITVSNVGMFGASWLLPIINPGQSAIVGVGKSRSEFRPNEHGHPIVREIVSLAISADHRIHNGAAVARFLDEVVNLIENPLSLLL